MRANYIVAHEGIQILGREAEDIWVLAEEGEKPRRHDEYQPPIKAFRKGCRVGKGMHYGTTLGRDKFP